ETPHAFQARRRRARPARARRRGGDVGRAFARRRPACGRRAMQDLHLRRGPRRRRSVEGAAAGRAPRRRPRQPRERPAGRSFPRRQALRPGPARRFLTSDQNFRGPSRPPRRRASTAAASRLSETGNESMRTTRWVHAAGTALALAAPSLLQAQHVIEEVRVVATPHDLAPTDVAQSVTVLAGDRLRRSVRQTLGETLAGELGVSSTYFGSGASRPVI